MGILSGIKWDDVQTGGEVLPEGVYNLTVLKAEEKTKEESGNTWVNLFCKVSEGDHEGKTINVNLYVVCPKSKTAENIAKAQVKTLFQNNGLESIDGVADLVGLSSYAKVTITKSEQYGDGNNVNFIKKKADASEKVPF
jgi:hypothetical protein